jgi:hypothetical protein
VFGASSAHWSGTLLDREVARFVEERAAAGTLNIQTDIVAWVHQLLNKVIFGEGTVVSWDDALAFAEVQASLITTSTLAHLVPPTVFGFQAGDSIFDLVGATSTRDALTRHAAKA